MPELLDLDGVRRHLSGKIVVHYGLCFVFRNWVGIGLMGNATGLWQMDAAVGKKYRLLKKFFDVGYTEKPGEVAAEIDKLVKTKKLSDGLRRPFKELAEDLRKAKEIAIISES